MIKNLYDEEIVKWVVEQLELKKEDFLDAFENKDDHNKGVFVRYKMTVKCAKFLQSKFKFSMHEALGSNLGTLSGHGEGGRTSRLDCQDFQYYKISFQRSWMDIQVRNNKVSCWLL